MPLSIHPAEKINNVVLPNFCDPALNIYTSLNPLMVQKRPTLVSLVKGSYL